MPVKIPVYDFCVDVRSIAHEPSLCKHHAHTGAVATKRLFVCMHLRGNSMLFLFLSLFNW